MSGSVGSSTSTPAHMHLKPSWLMSSSGVSSAASSLIIFPMVQDTPAHHHPIEAVPSPEAMRTASLMEQRTSGNNTAIPSTTSGAVLESSSAFGYFSLA